MNLSQLLDTDERGVSPVIGVILMVAITVILAAVIGTFVLGLGDQVQDTAPVADFGSSYSESEEDGDELTITFQTGDSIDASNLNITASNINNYDDDATDDSFNVKWSEFGGSGQISAGNSAEIDGDAVGEEGVLDTTEFDDDLDLTEATVRVTWQSDEGRSSTLHTWEGPDA